MEKRDFYPVQKLGRFNINQFFVCNVMRTTKLVVEENGTTEKIDGDMLQPLVPQAKPVLHSTS